MDALSILATVYRAGIRLDPLDDGHLEASGFPLTDELRDLVRAHRAALWQELQRQRIGELDSDFASLVPRRYAIPVDCTGHGACRRLGLCPRVLGEREPASSQLGPEHQEHAA